MLLRVAARFLPQERAHPTKPVEAGKRIKFNLHNYDLCFIPL